ncbi:MAG TPA: RsmB/NOP family class I SAM-dependent RNA methyltransferase, partial [Pyrinomonadaceae bacterium]|nr:RsmB/NOP family class I SAM-dependent RNA methyltransferase [Pyrinomonadaceae bacterium]
RLASATAFVNAVLRSAIREGEYDPAADVSDPLQRISISTSHPLWLIQRWATGFGLEETEAFAKANNTVPATAFRVVKNRANEAEVLEKLVSAGAKLEKSNVAEGAWRVSGATSILRELSLAGEIYIQDEASQLVSQMLNAECGECVLDLCAAPGGKTTLIADRADDKAIVIAADRYEARMATVIGTTKLHQLKSIKPLLLDAAHQLPFARGVFDKVLVDAPCSGTGTLRGNPEIRWRLSPTAIKAFADQQKRFLANAAEVLKPCGRLIYSTCSVEREENEEVIGEVIRADPRFELIRTFRTWPHTHGCDGFFIADLRLAAAHTRC